jgi:hypothetical protein
MLAAAEEAIDGGGRARIIAALRRLTGAQIDDQPRSATRAGVRIGGRARSQGRSAHRGEKKPPNAPCPVSAVRVTRHLHGPAVRLSDRHRIWIHDLVSGDSDRKITIPNSPLNGQAYFLPQCINLSDDFG